MRYWRKFLAMTAVFSILIGIFYFDAKEAVETSPELIPPLLMIARVGFYMAALVVWLVKESKTGRRVALSLFNAGNVLALAVPVDYAPEGWYATTVVLILGVIFARILLGPRRQKTESKAPLEVAA